MLLRVFGWTAGGVVVAFLTVHIVAFRTGRMWLDDYLPPGVSIVMAQIAWFTIVLSPVILVLLALVLDHRMRRGAER